MASTIKVLVSRKKKRYKEDGFNLDLTYIFENVIAMGYPAAKLEGVYRNHINDVYKFLETKHKDHYKIYNLCSERSYDGRRFHDRVSVFPFDDHNPPKLELIKPFCHDVDQWLAQDPLNVAVVHCKAGKGRTGLMICCYILHRKWAENADEALKHYGQTRTHDTKGVTIPSQRRYVDYYDQLLKMGGSEYTSCPIVLHELQLEPIPNFSGGCVPVLTVFEAESQVQFTPTVELVKAGRTLRITLNPPLIVKGDVRMTFKNKPNVMMLKEKMFHFWFNTFFVRDQVRLPPPSPLPLKNIEKKNEPVEVLDSTSSLTKADGLALKSKWGGALFDRPDRSGSCPANHLTPPNSLWPTSSRASSLNSVYSENSTNISDPAQWLNLTLTKRELDKACKDNNHRVFSSDFKVTLFFTRPNQNQSLINGVGSLPNMETAAVTNRNTLAVTNLPVGPRLSSPSTNGSKRPKSAMPSSKVPKPNSPRNHGLLGPICWRNPVTAVDFLEGTDQEFDQQIGLDGRPRHSDSSQTLSSDDSSDIETPMQNSDEAIRKGEIEDEEQDDSTSSQAVGRYRLVSYSPCTSGLFHGQGCFDQSQPDPTLKGRQPT